MRSAVLAVLALGVVASGCASDKKDDAGTTTSTRPVSTTLTSTTTSTTTPTSAAAVPTTAPRSSVPPSSTTTVAPTTSGPTPSKPPTSAPATTVPKGQPTPGQAAQGLIAAWQAGDRTAAARYADPAAVGALFALTREPVQAAGSCQQDGSAYSCPYFTKSGNSFFLRTSGSTAAGYRIAEVTTSTD